MDPSVSIALAGLAGVALSQGANILAMKLRMRGVDRKDLSDRVNDLFTREERAQEVIIRLRAEVDEWQDRFWKLQMEHRVLADRYERLQERMGELEKVIRIAKLCKLPGMACQYSEEVLVEGTK